MAGGGRHPVLLVGFVPTWLFMVRRPEDVGLTPDRRTPVPGAIHVGAVATSSTVAEPAFSQQEALRTPAFWLLALFTMAVYPVQAGISLHQAPYLIERGLSPTVAATIVSSFSLVSALSGLAFGLLIRRTGVRGGLGITATSLGASAIVMLGIATPLHGCLAAGTYVAWLVCFAVLSFIGAFIALLARASQPLHRAAHLA